MTKYHLYFLSLFLLPQILHADVTEWKANPNGQVRLISTYDSVPRQGSFYLGFQFRTAPGWYVYWKMAGDAGYPPKIDWTGSEGIKDPVLLWPAPTKFILPGNILEYGYQGEVVYPVLVQLDPSAGKLQVAATISYLTCNTSCVPYKYTFILSLPVGKAASDPDSQALIDRYLSRVPPSGMTDEAIMNVAPTVQKNDLGTSEAPASNFSVVTLLFFAFIGGIVLNFMPCVLPVLSIKLFGLVKQSGHAHPKIAANALLSAAGIVTSFLILAAVSVIAKAGGHAVGWGIQFQSPVFVMILAIVVFLFALNLWGVFEFGIPKVFGHASTKFSQHETALSHFMSGLFAAVLATPCSAPFLGTAMGFALTQPSLTVVAAFAMAGLGMALPYFLLAMFPHSISWLPKPGTWMIYLKGFFGILLAGTAGWLLWVFIRQVHPLPKEPFDESRIEGYVNAGRPVLVDVTADWCVTCKYNENFVLNSYDVKSALQKHDVVLMRADWTNRDETIRHYLAKYGRSGIPFYAYYKPGQEPVVLSEFLTKNKILQALE